MSEPIIVHELQTFKNLKNDMPCFLLYQRRTKILLQVAVWKILHRYKYTIFVVILMSFVRVNASPVPLVIAIICEHIVVSTDGEEKPLREIENDLMELFDYEHHELVERLIVNRDKVVWVTRWRRAQPKFPHQNSPFPPLKFFNISTFFSIMPPHRHYDTPRRARVQGAYKFLTAHAIPFDPRNIFKQFDVSMNVGYRLIEPDAPSRRNHFRMGRPYKVTPKQVREADQILQDDGKRLTWEQLAMEVGADVIGETMKHIMQAALDYEKCLACVNGWLNQAPMDKRVEWATVMLDRYPKDEDWDRVRFSDGVHFARGPEGKLRIIRRPGTRYRWDCIQHKDPPAAKDEKRMHCWAAIGYGFKSEIISYNVPGNSNGKMTHPVYIDSFLEPMVKPWLDRGDDFVRITLIS